jgi:hypothetical protein
MVETLELMADIRGAVLRRQELLRVWPRKATKEYPQAARGDD